MNKILTNVDKSKLNITDNMTYDEIRKIIDTIDPDTMGFNGDETPKDISEYIKDEKTSGAVSGVSIGNNGLVIVDNFTSINFTNKHNPKKYLVIHYTAGTVDNGSAAKANSEYFKNTYIGASAHFFVDCSKTIYRSVDEDLVAWHCGANKYYHPDCRNSNSISIEICSYTKNGVYDFKNETIENAIVLAKYLVNKYNIPKENVIMHWDVTHKICPAPFITNNLPNQRWYDFLDRIFDSANITPLYLGKVVNIKSSEYLNFRSGPGENYSIIGKFALNDTLNIIGENGNWYQVVAGNLTGFVSKSYISICEWADPIRDNLFNLSVITDKNEWSNYDEPITKALAVQLISNIYGTTPKSTESHWANNAVNRLIDKNIITDKSQWSDLDSYINKALFMALIDNATGGMTTRYKGRNADHWARNCLDSLCDKEIINDPTQWQDFEGQVQKGIALSLINNAYYKISR